MREVAAVAAAAAAVAEPHRLKLARTMGHTAARSGAVLVAGRVSRADQAGHRWGSRPAADQAGDQTPAGAAPGSTLPTAPAQSGLRSVPRTTGWGRY